MDARRRQCRTSLVVVRAEVSAALAERRAEIEEAITKRAFAVAEPTGAETPGYVEGLRAAISAAFDHALAAVEEGVERAGAIPPAILAQARSAARSRVGLEVVLRRYAAGYSVLVDFLLAEIRRLDQSAGAAESILQGELTSLFDRLVETVSREYGEEAERAGRSSAQRQADLLRRLLAGESIDRSRFNYDFEAHHLGALATGPGSAELLRHLAARTDRRLLLLEDDGGLSSGWFGGGRPFIEEELLELARLAAFHDGLLIIGEPGSGLRGWDLTHRQALAALGVANLRERPFTRYAEVALLAAVARDEDLASFLTETYLAPLEAPGDLIMALPQTLRAYLDAGRNLSSAAAALGVARQTVASRVRAIETRIGRPLDGCVAELEVALRLRDLEA
jgi:hypothetical protein